MYYHVTARLKEQATAEFYRKLTDGTVAAGKPDGKEIVASMNRAVVTDSGLVEWSERCFCETPLAHERETVLDFYFDDLQTKEVDGYQEHEGRPLMLHLADAAGPDA